MNKNLIWHNHIESRAMKTFIVFQMIRRNTILGVNNKANVHINKSLLIPTLLYASECYWPSGSDMRQINAMIKRVTYWILPVENYKERLLQLELLPILYYQESKKLLLLFNIVSNNYNVDFPNIMKLNAQIEEARVSNYHACTAKPSEIILGIVLAKIPKCQPNHGIPKPMGNTNIN